jgi:hypothetical protein
MKTLHYIITIILVISCFVLYQKQEQLRSDYLTTSQSHSKQELNEIKPAAPEIEIIHTSQDVHEQNYGENVEDNRLEPRNIDEQKQAFKNNSKTAWAQVQSINSNNIDVDIIITDVDAFFENFDIKASTYTDKYTIQINEQTSFEGTDFESINQGDFIKIHVETNIYESNQPTATKIHSFESGIVEAISTLEAEETLLY